MKESRAGGEGRGKGGSKGFKGGKPESEKQKKQKKKKQKHKDAQVGDGEKALKRKIIRGICEKHCVCCLLHSTTDDPINEGEPLKWGRPRLEDSEGVEGSQCFYCRRLHRAKACAQCLCTTLLVSRVVLGCAFCR